MATTAVNAEKVSKQEALQKAQKFMHGKNLSLISNHSHARGESSISNEAAYYIFNAEDNGGFVIVSGDDRIAPVLGYSDTGEFRIDNMPDNLRTWLDNYETQIKSLSSNNLMEQKSLVRSAKQAIEPLIKTEWGQAGAFNTRCPFVDGVHGKTGCVPTAIAQVMNYYKWPEQSPTLPSYVTGTKKIEVEALPATNFKWNLMKNTYASNETGASADAVAELMRYCGQCVQVDYGIEGSGALLLLDNLVTYFEYSRDSHRIRRTNHTYSEWEAIIYNELQEGRPVLMDAYDATYTCHEFICDGYDGNGLFHMNWGWYGGDNGYFLLSVRNDGETKISSDETDVPNYCYQTGAVIGLKPAKDENTYNDGILSYHYNNKTKEATITRGNYEGLTEVVIPESVVINGENYCVTAIGSSAFNHSSLQSLTIPASIRKIGSGAFYWNNQLEELNLTEGLEIIEEGAFEDCTSLEEVRIPSTVIMIGGNAFRIHTGNLKTIISYVENPSVISKNVFCIADKWEGNGWDDLKEYVTPLPATLYVPTGAKSKYESAGWAEQFLNVEEGEPFEYTIDIKYLCSPDSKIATVIKGDYSAIQELDIPAEIVIEGVKYRTVAIADDAFQYCYNLTSVVLHEGLKSIGNRAFARCYNLKSINIPNGLESIGTEAFAGCELKKFHLPASLKSIGGIVITFNSSESSVISHIRTPQKVQSLYTNFFSKGEVVDGNYVTLPSPATLYIPRGTIKTYRQTPGWNVFENIVELDDPSCGDLSGDGKADNVDLEELINIIMQGGANSKADLSGDGSVNGSDAVALANVIQSGAMGEGEAAFQIGSATAILSIADFNIKGGETKQLQVCVKNPEMDVTMVEFYLELPSGLSVVQTNENPDVKIIGRTSMQQHTLQAKTTGSSTHILVYSAKNTPLTGKYGALLGIQIKADDTFKDGTVILKNQLLADPYETECKPEELLYAIMDDYHYKDGDVFTTIIPDGIEMTFKVISAVDKTCQVGTGENNSASFDRTYSGELTIPATAKGYNVIRIAKEACSRSEVTKIKVLKGIQVIEERAFSNNEELESIELPEGIREIYNNILWECKRLKSFHLPSTVVSFNGSFGKCDALERITVAEGNYIYDSRDNCNAIIESANHKIIAGCKTTVIPYSVKSLGQCSFFCQTSLTEISIPEGVKIIDSQAFQNTSLKTIVIPSTIKTIESNAFYNCSSLTEVTIKCRTPFAIRDNVFSLSSYKGILYVPEDLKTLYEGTDGWKNFESVIEKEMDYQVGEFTREGVTYEYYNNWNYAVVLKGDAELLENMDVTIPSTIEVSGAIYPVKAIEDDAFCGCYNIVSLTIEPGLEEIGNSAFSNCSQFREIVIPEGVKRIGEGAFESIRNLNKVELPSSLLSVGERAFNCFNSNICTVVAHATEPCPLSPSAFMTSLWEGGEQVDKFTSATLYVPKGCVEKYRKADVWKNFENIVEILNGDVNGDKEVNVVDIVKLVNDKATQAEIDEVVGIILKKK